MLLRRKQISGMRFRRQHPIGPYIADFFCAAAKLVIELDGDQHSADRHTLHDEVRTEWLEKRGYRVLRFSNYEFLTNPDAVLDGICRAIADLTPPQTAFGGLTLPQGEGGR